MDQKCLQICKIEDKNSEDETISTLVSYCKQGGAGAAKDHCAGRKEGVGVTEEQHYHDQWSAQESSIAANPYVAAILANMPTGLPWKSEDTLTDQDEVLSQHSHKLHKEMELIAESVRQTRLDNSRTGMHVCVCV